jgi:hypothetical protein
LVDIQAQKDRLSVSVADEADQLRAENVNLSWVEDMNRRLKKELDTVTQVDEDMEDDDLRWEHERLKKKAAKLEAELEKMQSRRTAQKLTRAGRRRSSNLVDEVALAGQESALSLHSEEKSAEPASKLEDALGLELASLVGRNKVALQRLEESYRTTAEAHKDARPQTSYI